MKKDKLLLDKIKSKIRKVKVVSFDIFDTLLVRPYIRPTDLFIHMEKAYERPGFADERRDAERRTRIRHKELEDITFDMIYDEIDDEFKDMKQKEMDWEEMVLRANPELKQVYDYAKEQGKKIVIASDMYLPTEFIAKVLHKNGYDSWDKLYVSAFLKFGAKKRNGALFYQILQDLSVTASDMLHIGDNSVSDYEVPSVIGIHSVLIPKIVDIWKKYSPKRRMFNIPENITLGFSILSSVFAYNWQCNRCNVDKISQNKSRYWSDLGYLYTGPLAYGYMRWLQKEAEQRGIEKLLFVARSGYILKKIYDMLPNHIPSNYVYAPRSLKALCHLLIDYKDQYELFVRQICSKNDVLKQRFEQLKNYSLKSLETFFRCNYELFEAVSSKYAQLYSQYVKSICNKKNKIALVDDMASNFSAQYLLEKALDKQLIGFYFTVVYRSNCDNFERKSFASTYTDKKLRGNEADIWTRKWRFVEFLLGAPEYPILDMEGSNFIYDKNISKSEKKRCEIASDLVSGAVSFARDIETLFKGFDIFLDFASIVRWINFFLHYPSTEDYKYMSSLSCNWMTYNVGEQPFLVKKKLKDIFITKYTDQIGVNSTFFWPPRHKGVLVNEIDTKNYKALEIIGMPLSSILISNGKIIKKKCFGLVKIIKNNCKKKLYVAGIRIYKKQTNSNHIFKELSSNLSTSFQKTIDAISSHTERAIAVAYLHSKTFSDMKNKHKEQAMVLFGAGPSAKDFEKPNDADVYVGLNRACLYNKIHFDYLFSIDKAGLDLGDVNFYDDFMQYDAIKFVGDQHLGAAFQIPESIINKYDNVRRYKTTARYLPNKFALDLEIQALGNYASVALQAIQFMFYTNPQKIYIVGIDCTVASKQHFIGVGYDNSQRNESSAINDKNNIKTWKELKGWAGVYYPETEIISINPVGLKGIFRDVYTKSYLAKHPEIDETTVEILDEEVA